MTFTGKNAKVMMNGKEIGGIEDWQLCVNDYKESEPMPEMVFMPINNDKDITLESIIQKANKIKIGKEKIVFTCGEEVVEILKDGQDEIYQDIVVQIFFSASGDQIVELVK
jgi:hypothetical protein